MNEKDVQKKYLEYQLIAERLKQLQAQLETLDSQLSDIDSTVQSLDDFSSVGDSTEILVPINNGIFAKATLKKEGSLLVNIGASVVVDKSIEDTKKLVEKQKSDLQEVRSKMIENLQKFGHRAEQIEKELSQMMENV